MKKVISILCITLLSFTLFFSSSTNSGSVNEVNLASLISLNTANAEDDGVIRCRCHNDGMCYGGNAISFRERCATVSGYGYCDSYSTNC